MIRIITSKDQKSRLYVPMDVRTRDLTRLLIGPGPGVWYEIGETTQYIDNCIEALALKKDFNVRYEIDPRETPRMALDVHSKIEVLDALPEPTQEQLDEIAKSPILIADRINQIGEAIMARSGYNPNDYRSINQ